MHSIRRTIAKNTAWLLGSQVVGRLMRALLLIYAARTLGAASWGAFSYVLGIAGLLTIFSDIGINGIITREGSKNPELASRYFATAAVIKTTLMALMGITAFIIISATETSQEIKLLIPFALFVFIFDSFRELGNALARSLEKMDIEAKAFIATNFFITAFGALGIYLSRTSVALTVAYAVGAALGTVIISIRLLPYIKTIPQHFSKKLIKPILTTAWIFGLVGLMGGIMLNTDLVALKWITDETGVGLFSASQKLIQMLYIIPALLATAFFPSLARLSRAEGKDFRALLEKGLHLIMLVAFPLALGGATLARPIIETLYGAAYADASVSFAILSATILILFPASMISNAVFAHNKQKELVGYVALGIFGNLLFDIIFGKLFGMNGVALSTLANQLMINTYLWYQLQKITPVSLAPNLVKPAIAAILMSAAAYLGLMNGSSIYLLFGISPILYLGSLYLMQEPMLAEAEKIIRRKLKRAA